MIVNLGRMFGNKYPSNQADNRMASIKANQVNDRRTNIREMSERAQQEIYQYLPIYSQPSQRVIPDLDFKIRKFSQKSLLINHFNPETKAARKLPPMLRYQSQKYLKQQEQKRQEEEQLLRKKKLSIHTLALKQAEPLSIKSPSLPRIRKSQPHLRNQKDAEIDWITPEEFMSMKLQLSKKKATKAMRENQHLLSQRRYQQKRMNIINKHELISGWNTHEDRDPDLYE